MLSFQQINYAVTGRGMESLVKFTPGTPPNNNQSTLAFLELYLTRHR